MAGSKRLGTLGQAAQTGGFGYELVGGRLVAR